MALSRIWAAFIIVATLAATFKYISSAENKSIFNKMVVGKSGDTSNSATHDSLNVPQQIVNALDTVKEVKLGDVKFTRSVDNKIISYKEQAADGIIATCKTAVEIAINLIGIMALFMGFMSIAERAGGIRVLSKIIGPFFSRLFPELPKNHPAMGHMMLNFYANLLGLTMPQLRLG